MKLRHIKAALVTSAWEEHVTLVHKIFDHLKRELQPDESEVSDKPSKGFGKEPVLNMDIALRDYNLDINGTGNNKRSLEKKIETQVNKILKGYAGELNQLGMKAAFVPSEKAWFNVDFKWSGELDTSINEDEVLAVAKQVEAKAKPIIKNRGWDWHGIYRDKERTDPYAGNLITLHILIGGVTPDTYNEDDKIGVKRWNWTEWDIAFQALAPIVGAKDGKSLSPDGYSIRVSVGKKSSKWIKVI